MNFIEKDELKNNIYNYITKNAIGYENRIKSNEIMDIFEIKDNKTFRRYIESIRDDLNFPIIICSEAGKGGGYWSATTQEEVMDTLKHLYKRSIKMLYTYSTIRKKARLNNQLTMELDNYTIEIYKSIMEE